MNQLGAIVFRELTPTENGATPMLRASLTLIMKVKEETKARDFMQMMQPIGWTALLWIVFLFCAPGEVAAAPYTQNVQPSAQLQPFSVTITVDENGNGSLTNTDGFFGSLASALQNDPGPGGLNNVLAYSLLNPPGLTAGDVLITDDGLIMDVVRFNPSERCVDGSLGCLVFYSDNVDGVDALADTSGPPFAFYPNTITIPEIGSESDNSALYTPIAGQPGFVMGAGGPVHYVLISDVAVPEPASLAILGAGLVVLGFGIVCRRRVGGSGEKARMTQLFLLRGQVMIAAVLALIGISILPGNAAGDITVTVSVTASDGNNPLTYRWRSTDGQIIDLNASSTQWTLPAGPGLHFAYVLVSNGKGGYTERRIIVNTDGLSAVQPRPPMDLIVPGAPTSSAIPFRAWIGGGMSSTPQGLVSLPNANLKVALPDVMVLATGNPNLLQENVDTSLSGDLTFQAFSPQRLDISCTIAGSLFPCLGVNASFQPVPDEIVDKEANQTNRINLLENTNQIILAWVTGTALLQDGSTCGTEDEFFGVTSTATAELIDINGKTIPGSQVRANSWGQFSIPLTQSVHTSVVVRCEGAPPAGQMRDATVILAPSADASPSFDVGVVTINSAAPVVSNMSVAPALPATFDDPTDLKMHPPLPSDIVPLRPAKFLAMKGLDTRLSGCLYYKTIGAVKDCDAEGNFRGGAISFEDWKRTVKIDEYAPPGTQQYRAVFVNRIDLNLTRDHHSVSYPHTPSYPGTTGATAGYVCNRPGPTVTDATGLHHTQASIDEVIDNAIAGKNLVACVAMDYTVATGVNNNQPFSRFLIFGPSGDLLPSVNLDGRGEKFPPGTCTVCHGGNKYAGKFPEDGTGTADLDAHFLPFDIANFEFRSAGWPALTKEAQQEAIYQLNQNVLNTNANSAEKDLITGWYNTGHTQNTDYFPLNTPHPDFYLKVIARSCRTCHIAQRDGGSIRDLTFSKPGQGGFGALGASILKELVCGQTVDLLRAYAMPNSMVTFDLFWKSRGSINEPDQPQLVASMLGVGVSCTNPKP